MKDGHALVIVDPLRDFCPGGALAAPEGDGIIPNINRLAREGGYDLVVLVNEQHPEGHISFASRHGREPFERATLDDGREQMLWPDHCVEGTEGCQPHPDLDTRPVDEVVVKARRAEVENYSGFEDEDGHGTGLDPLLRENGIRTMDVTGIAAEYCVHETVLDARDARRSYRTRVIEDAVAGIEANEGDTEKALRSMEDAGAERIRSQDVLGNS